MIMIRTALLACTAALAAADADPLYGYAGHHLGYGTYGFGKRDADAEPEADADALYGSYGVYGLGHRTYSLGHGYGYGHLGYGHGYGLGYGSYGYGKRDAEAEPKADVDALYGSYGVYGLGHRTYSLGHGYGHLGYSS